MEDKKEVRVALQIYALITVKAGDDEEAFEEAKKRVMSWVKDGVRLEVYDYDGFDIWPEGAFDG